MITRKVFAAGAAFSMVIALAACSSEDSSQMSGDQVQSAASSSTASAGSGASQMPDVAQCSERPADAPEVDRSGEGVFPEVKGGFGEKPEIVPASGEQPQIIKAKTLVHGEGKIVCPDDHLVVNYAGVLWDGTPFDSSFDRGSSIDFSLNGVIQGWKWGLSEQRVGDRVLLVIPSEWGYGDSGTGNIPPKATLIFVVDIVESISLADTSALVQAELTGEALPEGLTVSGDLGTEPTVKFDPGATISNEGSYIIAQGKGPSVTENDRVVVRVAAVQQDGNEYVSGTTWATPQILPQEGIEKLKGMNEGSRVVLLFPAQGGNPAAAAVVDIVSVSKK